MSRSAVTERASGRVKGQTAEVFFCRPGRECWAVGKNPPDCHNLWRAIILRIGISIAVNVGVTPGFTVFLLKKERKF